MKLAPELGAELIDKFGDGKSLGDIAGQIASACEVPDEQSEDLMRIHKCADTVDSADAVAVAVRAKSRVEFSGEDSLPQRADMWFDRFRVDAAKTRITRTSNFFASNAVAP